MSVIGFGRGDFVKPPPIPKNIPPHSHEYEQTFLGRYACTICGKYLDGDGAINETETPDENLQVPQS